MSRLGKNQKRALEYIRPYEAGGIPLYYGHLEEYMGYAFYNETTFRKFVDKLKDDGYITVEKRWFIRITDLGVEKIESQQAKSHD